MGQGNSKTQACRTAQIDDERFGGPIDIINRTNRVYIVKTVTVSSEEELKWMVDLSIKRTRLKHRNFCTIRNYEIIRETDFCSNATLISLYFDYYPNDLEKEIEIRADKQEHFSEEWVGSTLYALIDCLRYLEEKGSYQGDIRTANILLDFQGNPKLIDSYFTHFGRSNFELMLQSSATLSYLSPQQLTNMRKGHYSSVQENKGKNQIFSLGMTIMQAMLLESSFECYQMNLFRLLEHKIKQRREQMLQYYSQPLVDLVLSLLEFDEKRRPSFYQALNNPAIKMYCPKISLSKEHDQKLDSSRATTFTPTISRQ